jgi:hypothetical protein
LNRLNKSSRPGKSLRFFRNRVKPLLQKYFCFSQTQISSLIRTVPYHKRAGSRSSRTRGGMRWTLAARETSAACWRTAKSCRSDAPMLASSLREEAQATVSNKPGRGEREVSRKTIARGMPGLLRCDRGDYARVLFSFAREAAGALGTRHSLRPLIRRARDSCTTRAIHAARSRRCDVIARSNATKQSILSWRGPVDCFACARNEGVETRSTLPTVIARLDRATQYSRGVSD